MSISDGQRVRVAGANGAGKSSLLAAMVAAARPDDVAVLPQRVSSNLDWLDRLDPKQRGRVLGTAARLGVVADRVLAARAT